MNFFPILRKSKRMIKINLFQDFSPKVQPLPISIVSGERRYRKLRNRSVMTQLRIQTNRMEWNSKRFGNEQKVLFFVYLFCLDRRRY